MSRIGFSYVFHVFHDNTLYRKKYFPDVRGVHGFYKFAPESLRATQQDGMATSSSWGRGRALNS